MPATGGFTPSPERYGAGEGNSNVPLVQRVVESIQAQIGSAYTNAIPSFVFVQALAFARAIVFDGYGASQRLSNQFIPSKMTDPGLLPRWEKILGLVVYPSDTQVVRRARVGAAFAAFAKSNAIQPVIDQLTSALGPVYVGITTYTPATATTFWPGFVGSVAGITGRSGLINTLTGMTGVTPVSTACYGASLTLSNCNTPANNGTFPITSTPSSTSVTYYAPSVSSTDYGVGGTSGSPTIQWQITNPWSYWSSSIANLTIQVKQPAGYTAAQFYAAIANIAPIMEAFLPAWMTWNWYVNDSGGVLGFKLDEPNLDLEAFGV